MDCRPGCGACCIAPSISSPIPGMPQGKPAGLPCPQLDEERRCRLFATLERPEICVRFRAGTHCGDTPQQALALLTWLEQATA